MTTSYVVISVGESGIGIAAEMTSKESGAKDRGGHVAAMIDSEEL